MKEIILLTRQFPLQFEDGDALTHLDLEQIRQEVKDQYDLIGEFPASVSVSEGKLHITFLMTPRRQAHPIGFGS